MKYDKMSLRLKRALSRKKTAPEIPQNPYTPPQNFTQKRQKSDLALLLYQPLISHFKIDFLSEAAGFRAKKVPKNVGGVKSA